MYILITYHSGLNIQIIRWILPMYLSLLMFTSCSSAQSEQIEHKLTLSSAIKYSLEQNPSLRVFEVRNLALNGQEIAANLKPVYEVGIKVENFLGSGNFTELESAELTISLSSVIEMGDKRMARVNVISNSRAQLIAQRQIEALELLGEVTRRYIDVLAAQERVILAEEAVQLAEDALTEIKKLSTAGIIPEVDVIRAQAGVEQARLRASSEKQQLKYLKVALTVLWGDKTPSFTRAEGNLFKLSEDVEFQILYARVEQNPVIQVFASEVRLKESKLRLAKTQESANIRWSIGLRQFQETDETAIMAGFSVPLFSSKRSSGSISSAMAARDEVLIRKEVTLLKLYAQLFHAYSNRQQAIFTIKKLENSIIPSLQQALKKTQNAYLHGRYSYLDQLTSRQELITARRALIEAASAYLRYGSEIEQLTSLPLSASQYSSLNKYPGIPQ